MGWEMDAALDADILLFNVESEAELVVLSARAAAKGQDRQNCVAGKSRCVCRDPTVYLYRLREHKFGIAIEKARAMYQRAAKMTGLEPVGVSVHIGSQIFAASNHSLHQWSVSAS